MADEPTTELPCGGCFNNDCAYCREAARAAFAGAVDAGTVDGDIVFVDTIASMTHSLSMLGVVASAWVFEQKGDIGHAVEMETAIEHAGGLDAVEAAVTQLQALLEAIR